MSGDTDEQGDQPRPRLSFVIPVYNSEKTVGSVVQGIVETFRDLAFEVVLVNDGSLDESERVCSHLAEQYAGRVVFVQLARNFGEHNAVLAGLHHTRGECVVVLDDDGQNPPAEARELYEHLVRGGYDAVYGRYVEKQHSRWRNLGSRFNDGVANLMLKKPPELYLSSFKAMSRFLVDEIQRYEGAFPYIDGLILRTTRNLSQIDVEHREAERETSGYTLRKLAGLWFNMFINFSITPLRLSALLGVFTSALSLLLLAAIVIDKLYINPTLPHGLPTVLSVVTFFAGVQLIILGTIGEYLGRLFLDQSRSPQFVVRYVRRGEARSSG
jgi:glycosyltransferase involved in cell wall biosynthesis